MPEDEDPLAISPPTAAAASGAGGWPPASELVTALRAAGCVFAEDEAALLRAEARSPLHLAELTARRVAGAPLEHILGWASFLGHRVLVHPGVFVPRRRTELLVELALAALAARGALRPARVVDLCCGSGAVGMALASSRPGIELHAIDIDPAAVRCARQNIPASAGQVYQGDLDGPLPTRLRGAVDVLTANVPYVPTRALRLMPPEARQHEPRAALDGGPEGLDLLLRVAALAPRWLAPGGEVLMEAGAAQAPTLLEALGRAGLSPSLVQDPDREATVVRGASAQQEAGAGLP